jgi:hypothetical protein
MRQTRFATLPAAALAAFLLSSCGDSGEKAALVYTYAMGDRATVGHIVYKVFETQWLTQIGQGADARIPQHRFFLIRLSAVNSFGSDVSVPAFTLEDDHGNSYPEQTSGEGVNQYIGYLRSVKPAESVEGNALFDAPPAHYKMKVSDETGEKTAYIDIPLSFTSAPTDVPEVVSPEKKVVSPEKKK